MPFVPLGLELVPEGLFLSETWGNTRLIEQKGQVWTLLFQAYRTLVHRCHIFPVLSLASCSLNLMCTALVCFFPNRQWGGLYGLLVNEVGGG